MNPANVKSFVDAVRNAQRLVDAAQKVYNLYETYKKYQWVIDLAQKAYSVSKMFAGDGEMQPKYKPWVTVDIYSYLYKRRLREQQIKREHRDLFTPKSLKGKPITFGEGKLGSHHSDSGW